MTAENPILNGSPSAQGVGAPAPSRLQHYLNARVMVYYTSQSSYTDTGRITYLDPHWLELTKENGERLLMPTVAVRILKLLEPIAPTDDSGTLLRPLGTPPSLE
jgi:hypothetical protein